MQAETKTLALVTAVFFFASNLSGSFLTVYYYEELGLSILEIVEILLFTFLIVGFLPTVLLKKVRNFERIISLGIFLTMIFYAALIFVKNPVILGIAYGLSIATFWPSFNLLQFRLSESKLRARTITLFSLIIPSLAGIIGPVAGGFTIENFSFAMLFTITVALYAASFFLSLRMRFRSETQELSVPKSRNFVIFFATFIILGLSESYWIAYPLFVKNISETFLNMGLILALSALLMCGISFLVNWLSDVKKTRVSFAVLGTLLNIFWYFALAFALSSYELVALSVVSGLGSAFNLSWFAHYGDSFPKKCYASILVLMEVGLMIGRIIGLVPTYIFVSTADFQSYFIVLGATLFALIPLLLSVKKENSRST